MNGINQATLGPVMCPKCGTRHYTTLEVHQCPWEAVPHDRLIEAVASSPATIELANEFRWRMEQRNQGEWSGTQEPDNTREIRRKIETMLATERKTQ